MYPLLHQHMGIAVGTRFGSYEVLAPLGAGGMGEVYRARDSKLGRDVALKVLPSETSADPERRSRFEQEARSASGLNHPNIITVHEIGSVDSTVYIAMELVEGKTLREILAPGPLPTRKLLDVAVQVAEGLAKAHAAGIIHRDLKPENLMVSKDGFVKILDFGLAKLAPLASEGISDLPTQAAPGTRPGTVIGTVGYMSPEQASGQAVDFRSDQFSFGSILYEMATGKRAFQRKTGPETLAAIIREEPEAVAQINPRAPAPLRWIVERCLAKEPEERYVSTKDLARDLHSVREHLSETSVSVAAQAVGPFGARMPAWIAAACVALLGGLAVGFFLGMRVGGTAPEPARDIQRLTFRRGAVPSARFAPDGQTIVYGAAWEGSPIELYSSRPDSPESRSLGLPAGDVLSVSSTGELAISIGRRFRIGWESTGTLARVPLGGGAPREVLENVQEADWAPDGEGMAVVRDNGQKRRLEFPVGKVLYETAGWISDARFSRDGRRIAFADHPQRGDNAGSIAVVTLDGAKKELSRFGRRGLAWSPGGDEVWYSAGSTLRAVSLSGSERALFRMPGGVVLHDVSRAGRVLVSRSTARREIVGLAPGETRERNLSWLDWSFPQDLSEDGRTLLFDEQNQVRQDNEAIYLRRTDGSPAVRLGEGRSQALSPDGRWALTWVASGAENRLVLLPTGAGEPRPLPASRVVCQWASWFPDGRRILVTGDEPGHGSRLYVQDVSGGAPKPISPEGVSAYWKALFPDGTRVVALGPDRRPTVYPIEPGEPRAVPGLSSDDIPIRWTSDGLAIYVMKVAELPARVSVVEVSSGRRTLWKELSPPDPAGILAIGPILMTPDGRSYVYSYRRILDDLYLIEGLR